MELMNLLKGQAGGAKIMDRPTKVLSLPVEAIKANPYQPRRVFEDVTLTELSQSIQNYGVMQPITVRKIGSGLYELVAGERRLRASKLAGRTNIPAIVVDIDNDNSAVLALLENLQRENLSYMEEAEGYARLINMHGFTQDELATKLGKKQSTVANKLRLLRLPPPVKAMLQEYGLTERHARALLKLKDEAQMMDVLDVVTAKRYNVKETERYIEQLLSNSLQEQEKKKRLYKVKDIRIFTNTIKQAVDMMVNSGIPARSHKKDCGDHLEYTVIIPKA